MSRPVPIVTAPKPVRILAAIFLGLAVGVMGMPISNGFKVIGLVISVAIALLITFNHPYRKEVRHAVESRGGEYKTSVSQVMPLFPLWLALMLIPLAPSNWPLAICAWLIAAAFAWAVHPQLDGTAHLPRK